MQLIKQMYQKYGFYAYYFCKECVHYVGSKKDGYQCEVAKKLGLITDTDTWKGNWPTCGNVLIEEKEEHSREVPSKERPAETLESPRKDDNQAAEATDKDAFKQLSVWDLDGIVPDGSVNPF